jgi:rfaE bifunctional protein nucleotidyltransferase chain/domain
VEEAVASATAYVAAGGAAAALARPGPGPAGVPDGVPAARPASVGGTPVDPKGQPGNGRSSNGQSGNGNGQHPARYGAEAAGRLVTDVRARGGSVVASGGCFDLLHAGHVATLEAARRLGDCLVVCLNSDASVRALKGPDRPVVSEADRARLLAALECVDAVVVFDEVTPHAVLSWLRPDVWVKGGDYSGGAEDAPDLPEAELVARWGGQTVVVPYLDGRSTTRMIAAARRGEHAKGAV